MKFVPTLYQCHTNFMGTLELGRMRTTLIATKFIQNDTDFVGNLYESMLIHANVHSFTTGIPCGRASRCAMVGRTQLPSAVGGGGGVLLRLLRRHQMRVVKDGTVDEATAINFAITRTPPPPGRPTNLWHLVNMAPTRDMRVRGPPKAPPSRLLRGSRQHSVTATLASQTPLSTAT